MYSKIRREKKPKGDMDPRKIFRHLNGVYETKEVAYSAIEPVYYRYEHQLIKDFYEFMFWFQHAGWLKENDTGTLWEIKVPAIDEIRIT